MSNAPALILFGLILIGIGAAKPEIFSWAPAVGVLCIIAACMVGLFRAIAPRERKKKRHQSFRLTR